MLQKESSLRQTIFFQNKLKGVSINGRIIAVKEDKLKLHLFIDTAQPIDKAAWFLYNTLYTTEGEGTTGFYCMPQIGDIAALYIPETDERNAYIKTVIREDGKKNNKTQTPKVKRLQTIDGKEMIFSPEGIQFTANELNTVIDMQDTEGIQIHCNNDIYLRGNKMKLSSKESSFIAHKKIVVRTQNSNILINQKVHLKSNGGVNI